MTKTKKKKSGERNITEKMDIKTLNRKKKMGEKKKFEGMKKGKRSKKGKEEKV